MHPETSLALCGSEEEPLTGKGEIKITLHASRHHIVTGIRREDTNRKCGSLLRRTVYLSPSLFLFFSFLFFSFLSFPFLSFPFLFFLINLFIYRENTRVIWWRAERKERERIPSRLYWCQHGDGHGVRIHKLWDHDLCGNQESDTQPTEPPRFPRSFVFSNMNILCYKFLLSITLAVFSTFWYIVLCSFNSKHFLFSLWIPNWPVN